MPSFDIVSRVDMAEVKNAVNQAQKEISQRYDFKGAEAGIEETEKMLVLKADTEYRIKAVWDILQSKLIKRGIPLASLKPGALEPAAKGHFKQNLEFVAGIDRELAKKLNTLIKDAKLKVQSTINGEEVRVTGKKRDDLQECIALLKASGIEQPLQYVNFRD